MIKKTGLSAYAELLPAFEEELADLSEFLVHLAIDATIAFEPRRHQQAVQSQSHRMVCRR